VISGELPLAEEYHLGWRGLEGDAPTPGLGKVLVANDPLHCNSYSRTSYGTRLKPDLSCSTFTHLLSLPYSHFLTLSPESIPSMNHLPENPYLWLCF